MLDKARFKFSPLGQRFNTGLDKNTQGYQEEGIIKLLKDIRDGLAGGITPRAPKVPGAPRGSDDDDDDDDMPDLETEEEAAKTNILNKINNFDEMVKNKLNNDAKKLNKLNNDVKKLRNCIEENNDKIINKEKVLKMKYC